MRTRLIAALLFLSGCPEVQVPENIQIDVPESRGPGDAGAESDSSPKRTPTPTPRVDSVTLAADADDVRDEDDAGVAEHNSAEPAPEVEPAEADFDHDGIPDSLDVCPTDNPNDRDHDGKCDSRDPCPLDAFDDHDGDGLCDSLDSCPDGKDSDGDGICDNVDKCPYDAPNDTDGDGRCDSADPCPRDALDDSDGDGMCDSVDECQGFDDFRDSDRDGIPDDCDPCLENGIDADNDGIADACEKTLWSFRSQAVLKLSPIGSVKAELSITLPDGATLTMSDTVSSTRVPTNTLTLSPGGGLPSRSVAFSELATALTTQSDGELYGSSSFAYDAQDYFTSGGRKTLSHWIHHDLAGGAVISRLSHVTRVFRTLSYNSTTRLATSEWRIQGY